MTSTISLLPKPERGQLLLSARYSTPAYRGVSYAAEAPRYRPYAGKADCDECAAVQHEQAGNAPPRRPAKVRRTCPHGPDLLLCREHRVLWEERDSLDGVSR